MFYFTIESVDGEIKYLEHAGYGRFAYRTWGGTESSSGTLFLLHGLGEHGGRWEWISRWFAMKGWHCVVPDHFGHGLSAGRRCHINRFEDWSDQIVRLRSLQPQTSKPTFLFGHSLGGLIGMHAVVRSQELWNGCVFSAPWLQLALEGRNFEKQLAGIASRWFPTLSFPTGLREDQMADELLVALKKQRDALMHKRITALAYVEILDASRRILKQAHEFQLPCLLTHGETDPVMNVAGSQAWLRQCGSSEKSLHIFEGEKHEPHHGRQRESALEVIHEWLQLRS